MDTFKSLVDALDGYVWGPITLALLMGTGIFFTLRLFGLQIRKLPYALRLAFWPKTKLSNEEGDVSQFGALMTALSATIGTGNIVGVATAVVAGGPGAVLWMWLTALFGMSTKFAEGLLGSKYRIVNEKGEMSGGPMYYIQNGLNLKWLAFLFALFGALAAFGIGSSVQANSVAGSVHSLLGVPTYITGILLTIFTALVVLGGIQSISRAASYIVPLMALFYVLGGLIIIFNNAHLIGPAFETIFADAFSLKAGLGALLGNVIRYGVARGAFSNEAGLGSGAIPAAAARVDHPVRQGLVSMTGTFIDTIVVCSITGLVIVMAGIYTPEHGIQANALTQASFNHLLPHSDWIVGIGLIFFAYSTVLGWCYYGEKCFSYIFGEKIVTPYRIVYIITVFLGAIANLGVVWSLADIFNGLMIWPNAIGLLLLSGVVQREVRDFFNKRKSGELPY